MRDNLPDPHFFSGEESPIPVPPADGPWADMQKKLDEDKRRPVGWWWVRGAVIAAALLGGMMGYHYLGLPAGGQRERVAGAVNEPDGRHRQEADTGSSVNAAGSSVNAAGRSVGDAGWGNGARAASAGGTQNEHMASAGMQDRNSVSAGTQNEHMASAGMQDRKSANAGTQDRNSASAGMQDRNSVSARIRDRQEADGKAGTVGAGDSGDLAAYVDSWSIPLPVYPFAGDADTGHHLMTRVGVPDSITGHSGKARRVASTKKSLLMTAGLSLAQNAPLGKQWMYAYNVNGKSNLLSDYIPAPYFQYYLRKDMYLQASFRFNSPQYISSRVVDTVRAVTDSHLITFTTSTLQKLYYSDITLTAGYAPFPHWFLGMGLQYSPLRGGMVYQRVVSYDSASILPTNYHTAGLTKTMEQAIQLRHADWRFLWEASYRWKKVTLGVRYQQGLVHFSKVSAEGSVNNAAGLYLQYDLWERRRKK